MSEILQDLLSALFFFAPAGIANTAPVWFAAIGPIKRFNQPLDFGKHFRGKRIFGSHKTIRGLLAGTITGAVIGLVQQVLISNFSWFAQFNIAEDDVSLIVLGALLGTGALLGDALKSFFKRQVGVKPGKSWFPFDQADFIIGGLAFSVLLVNLSSRQLFFVVFCYLCLHPFFSLLGYILKLKKDPF